MNPFHSSSCTVSSLKQQVSEKNYVLRRLAYNTKITYLHEPISFFTGNLDRDAECYQYTDIAKVYSNAPPRHVPYYRSQQNLLVKEIDIYEVARIFTDLALFSEQEFVFEEEPEIVLDYW